MKIRSLFRKGMCAVGFLALYGSLNAQSLELEWAENAGGEKEYTIGNSVITDREGNVYTTGYFTGKVSFYQGRTQLDPWRKAFGKQDAFVMKHNEKGELLWVQQFGGDESVARGNSIALDLEQGFVYITGTFMNTLIVSEDENPLESVEKSNDIFVVKLTFEGDHVWSRSYGGPGDDAGESIAVDAQSDIYVTGHFSKEAKFGDRALTSHGAEDAFVIKLQSEGAAVMWLNQIGGKESERGTAVAVHDHGVYITGTFMDVIEFEDNSGFRDKLASRGGTDIYIGKLNHGEGHYKWMAQLGGEADDQSTSIALDDDGGVYTTGIFREKADFDPSDSDYILVGDGKGDIFISKLNIEGMFEWAKQMGGESEDIGHGIVVDQEMNVYSIGVFLFKVDFDPNDEEHIVELKGRGIYIHKLDSKGQFDWVRVIELPEYGDGYDIALDEKGSLYATGNFSKVVDFDPSPADVKELKALGIQDMFVLKLNQNDDCTSEKSFSITECDKYEWAGEVFTKTGNYTKVFQNQAKCDSTVTLILTINNSERTELERRACDTYVFDGKTLTQSGQYTMTEKTQKGCDSVIVLNLEITRSSTVAVTENACDSFTLDGMIYYTKSGVYEQTFENKAGCDSVVTLNLTINNSEITEIEKTACGSFTLGEETYTETGTYTQNLVTAEKCDSTVILDLTITKVDISVSVGDKVLTANAVGALYQWIDCDKNEILPNATSQFFRPEKNGNYSVIVTVEDCVDTSACYEVTDIDVGIDKVSFTGKLNIYPNPTQGKVNISVERPLANASVAVINAVGQKIAAKTAIYGSTFELDLSACASGIYLIELQEGSKTYRMKIIKD